MIDTHAHLDHVEDLAQILGAASAAGVGAVVAVGENLASNIRNLGISREYAAPKIFPAFGFHPASVPKEDPDPCLDFIRAHAGDAIAVGEIGLDFWYPWAKSDETRKEEQFEVFRCLLRLARDHDLPAVIHSRGAWKECLALAGEMKVQRAVFHWYSGPLDVLSGILAAGYYISCSPSLAYSRPAREAVRNTPVERLLVETDTPVYYRGADGQGFTAGPKDVFKTLAHVCALKNMAEADAEQRFDQNAFDFFRLDQGLLYNNILDKVD